MTTADEEREPAQGKDGDAREQQGTVTRRPVGLRRRGRHVGRVPLRPHLVATPVGAQPAAQLGAAHEGPLAPDDPLRVRPWRGGETADEPDCAERDRKRQQRRKHQGDQ